MKVGLHKIHGNGAIFSYVKEGNLIVLNAIHVDNLIRAGNERCHAEIQENNLKYYDHYINIAQTE